MSLIQACSKTLVSTTRIPSSLWARVLLLAIVLFALSPSALAQFPISEAFKTGGASSWVFGGAAQMTGNGTIDPLNDGWLRLTSAGTNQSGYAYYNQNFPSTLGIEVDFDYLTWGGTGADGISIFLFDGTASPFKIGDFGGALGYCQGYNGSPGGVSKAYVGIGLDEYGNFANRNDRCPNGGTTAATPDSVVIRGPGDAGTGYGYLAGTGTLAAGIDLPTVTSRPTPSTFYRRVSILIAPIGSTYQITVKWQTSTTGALTTILGPFTMPSAPPTNLKIGFAASSGGATNYHEIRNLSIRLPTDLKITKTVSAAAGVSPKDSLTYTISATNLGPNSVTGATLIDTPPSTLQVVSWNCSATSGAACGGSSGTSSINIPVSLNVGSSITITLNVVILPAAAATTVINQTSLSPPPNIQDTDISSNTASASTVVTGYSISGRAYLDANHNSIREPNEAGLSSVSLTLGGAVITTATTNASGLYTFSNLPIGNFNIAEAAPVGYVLTTANPRNLTLVNQSLTDQNFGNYNGAKITGRIFRDDGFLNVLSGPYSDLASANDAVQNANERGVANLQARAVSASSAVLDSSVTDIGGNYTLWVPVGSTNPITVSHVTNPPTGTNINGSSVVKATAFNQASARARAITFTAGTVYSGYNFGVVEASELVTDMSSQARSPGSAIYAHLYRPGTLGLVNLTPLGASAYGYLVYFDSDCNGTIDTSERINVAVPSTSSSGSYTVGPNHPREASGRFKQCALEVVVNVPAGRPTNEQTTVQLTARLFYQGNTALVDAPFVRDITRINPRSDLTLNKVVRNVTTAGVFATSSSGKPGETLEYCINLVNNGSSPLSSVVFRDPVPFYTDFSGVTITLTLGATSTTLTATADADAGEYNASINTVVVRIGTMAAGATGSVCYRVKIR